MAKFDFLLLKKALTLNLRKVFLIFLSLFVAGNIVFSMAALYFDIQEKMSEELRSFGANLEIFAKNSPLNNEKLREIEKIAPNNSIKAKSPYLYGVLRSDLEKIGVVGLNLSQQKYLNPYWQIKGVDIGVDFDDKNALIGKNLAQRLDLKLGDKINLYQNNEKKEFKIKGIVESGERVDNLLILNYEFLENYLKIPANHAFLNLKTEFLGEFSEIMAKNFPELEIQALRKITQAEGEILRKIKALIGIITFLILFLTTLSTNTTIFSIVSERQEEFALKKALGARNLMIAKEIILEILTILFIALIFSFISGYFLAQVLAKTVFSEDALIQIQSEVFLVSIFLTLTTCLLATLIPLKRIFKIDTALALKGE